jgi:hypothetical protein
MLYTTTARVYVDVCTSISAQYCVRPVKVFAFVPHPMTLRFSYELGSGNLPVMRFLREIVESATEEPTNGIHVICHRRL